MLSLDAKQKTFIEKKTLVSEVLFSGLDERYDDSDYVLQDPIYESDVQFALRQGRNVIRPNEQLSLYKVGNAISVVKELLFQKGYFNAKVVALGKQLARNEMAIILSVERGPKSEVADIRFEGMKIFAEEELKTVLRLCLGSAWGKYNLNHIDYCVQKEVRGYMWEHGYLQSKVSAPSRKFGEETVEIRFHVREGIRYRFGEMSIIGNKIFTDREILEILDISKGDVANVKNLRGFPDSKFVDIYKNKGYLNISAEFEPKFIPPPAEGMDGIVNINFLIDEGPQFKFGSIKFIGVTDEIARELKNDFPLKRDDIYDQKLVDSYIKKLNESGKFKPIDPNRDVEVLTPVDEPSEASAEGKIALRPPSEWKNDIDLRVNMRLKND